MSSWNESFQKAEAGNHNRQSHGIQNINSAGFIRIVSAIDAIVRELTIDKPIPLSNEIANLGERGRMLLSAHLLRTVEFYESIEQENAKKKALEFVNLLKDEYGVRVNMYDYQSN